LKNSVVKIIVILAAITLFSPVVMAAVTNPTILNYQGRLLSPGNVPLAGNYDFRFSLWTDADTQAGESGAGFACALPRCSWFETQTKTTDAYGLFNTLVGAVTPLPPFDFTKQKFLQVEVRASGVGNYEVLDPDGVDNLTDRKAVTSFPYASNADTIDSHDVGAAANNIPSLDGTGLLNMSMIPGGTNVDSFEVNADHTVGATVELRFGDSLATEVLSWDPNGVAPGNGWFNFTDDVRIQGNLTVTGLINGVDITTLTGSAIYRGLTVATFNGNIGVNGYNSAHAACVAAGYAGSHMCTTNEILYSIAQGVALPADQQGWISNGPPGYTSNSNDCSGWTNNSNTGYYGPFWDFAAGTGGKGWMAPCNVTKKIACCK